MKSMNSMNSMWEMLKSVYHVVVPLSIRNSRLVSRLKGFVYESLFGYDAIYDSDYYARFVEGPAVRSAEAISESILLDLRPKTVVDVGCGTGPLLEALRKRGCQVLGLEYSEAALQYCRTRKLDVRKFNLERDTLADDLTFDVGISIEVAEHLPDKAAGRYVDLLARLSSVFVFTAAPPGQGGNDHVNEQPPSYWISKFRAVGFVHDEGLSRRWRESWRDSTVVDSMYYQNLMIFRRDGADDIAPGAPLDPERSRGPDHTDPKNPLDGEGGTAGARRTPEP